MPKKRFLLLGIIMLVLLSISVYVVGEGCCASPEEGCVMVVSSNDCSGTYNDGKACFDVDVCDEGCCAYMLNGEKEGYPAMEKISCEQEYSGTFYPISEFDPGDIVFGAITSDACKAKAGVAPDTATACTKTGCNDAEPGCWCGNRKTEDDFAYCCANNTLGFTTTFKTKEECQAACNLVSTVYSVSGKVKRKSDGTVLRNALVTDGTKLVKTDASGNYKIYGLSAGTPSLKASKETFADVTQSVTISNTDLENIDFELVPQRCDAEKPRAESDCDCSGNGVFDTLVGWYCCQYPDGRSVVSQTKPCENCTNRIDDDEDGNIDCDDPKCTKPVSSVQCKEYVCKAEKPWELETVGDGCLQDTDCTGNKVCQSCNCVDPGEEPPTGTVEICTDGTEDEDGDGKVDCLDPDCFGKACKLLTDGCCGYSDQTGEQALGICCPDNQYCSIDKTGTGGNPDGNPDTCCQYAPDQVQDCDDPQDGFKETCALSCNECEYRSCKVDNSEHFGEGVDSCLCTPGYSATKENPFCCRIQSGQSAFENSSECYLQTLCDPDCRWDNVRSIEYFLDEMNYDKCVCQGSTRTQGFCCKNGLHSNTADGCAVEEGKYTISGKVTKQGTNSPVYGAVVTLTSKGRSYQSLPTSTSGTYAISAVEPGKYSVSVAAWCYEEKNLETNIYRNEEINFEIKQMQNFPVTGFVTDKETGDAIKDATVTFGDSFSIKTNNQGKFTKSAVCEGEYQVKASAEGYGTNRTNVRVTQRTTVTFELSKVQCYYPDLRPSPTLLDVAHARAEKLTITWENDCEPEDFTIYRCEGEDCNSDYDPVSGKLSPDTTEFEDTTVKPNTHYCYVVSAFYLQDEDLFGSGIHNSQKKCMATGDELCMKTDTEQFCVTGDNDVSWVSSCNADNEVEKEINCREDEPYGEDFVCMGPDDFGDAHCRYKSKCVQCGTPFSMFSTKSFGSVPYGKRDIPQVCQQIPYCYYDYSDTTADQFYECQGIESCYDYRSQKACEEDDTAETIQNNKCLNRNCTWNPDPRYGALGVGICAEKDEEFQNCSLCDNEDGSNMFRKCDRTTCDLYGDCYYDASEPTCRNKRDMACIYYATKNDCIGDQEVVINVLVDGDQPSLEYSEPQNSVHKESHDLKHLGKCKWQVADISAGGYCYKDADNNSEEDCEEIGKGIINTICEKDNEPPVTSILPKIPVLKDAVFNVTVEDNNPDAEIETYFCNVSGSCDNVCYPDILATENQIYKELQDGQQCIYYYSKDDANNLEVAQNIGFKLDSTPPNITYEDSHRIYKIVKQDGEDEYLTDLTVAINILDEEEDVSCDFVLKNTNDEPTDTPAYEEFKSVGFEFSFTKERLADGFYDLLITCTDHLGNVAEEQGLIRTSSDNRLFDPLPSDTRSENTGILLSVHTQNSAECRWDTEDKEFSEMELASEVFDMEGKADTDYLHTYTLDLPDEIAKTIILFVKCKFTETGEIVGNDGDIIRFTIDMQEPESFLLKRKIDEEDYDTEQWLKPTNQVPFKIRCRDKKILDPPGEFKCNANSVHYCEGYGCTPLPKQGTVTGKITDYTPSKTENLPIYACYYSKDAGGNPEQPTSTCFLQRLDGASPLVENLEVDVVGDLSIKQTIGAIEYDVPITNQNSVDVSGEVENVVIYDTKDGELAPGKLYDLSLSNYKVKLAFEIEYAGTVNRHYELVRFGYHGKNGEYYKLILDRSGEPKLRLRSSDPDAVGWEEVALFTFGPGSYVLTIAQQGKAIGFDLDSETSSGSVNFVNFKQAQSHSKIGIPPTDSPEHGTGLSVTYDTIKIIADDLSSPITTTVLKLNGENIPADITLTNNQFTHQGLTLEQEGRNIVSLEVVDEAGNSHLESTYVIRDTTGPVFSRKELVQDECSVKRAYLKDGDDLGGDHIKLEYSCPAKLTVEAEDTEWTNEVKKIQVNLECLENCSADINLGDMTKAEGSFSVDVDNIDAGRYKAVIHAFDALDNLGETNFTFVAVDSIEPAFNISIVYPEGYPYEGVLVHKYNGQTPMEYEVIIESNEKLSETLPKLTYSWGTSMDEVTGLVKEDDNTYTGKITIGRKGLLYFEIDNKPAEFSIECFDKQGTKGTRIDEGKDFIIDTKGPEAPVKDYPTDTIIFTQNPVLIAGHEIVKMPNYKIYIYANDEVVDSNDLQRFDSWSYDDHYELKSGNVSGIHNDKTFVARDYTANEGDKQEIIFKPQVSSFGQGLFKHIEFENHPSPDVLYYNITSDLVQDPTHEETKLEITPALKTDIPAGTKVFLHNTTKPQGYFHQQIDPPGPEKTMHLYFQAEDEHGLKGDVSENLLTIVFDQVPPFVEEFVPADGSVSSDDVEKVTAKIKDAYSGIDTGTVILSINDTAYKCGAGITCKYVGTSNRIVTLELTKDHDRGDYNCSLEFHDKAGNYFKHTSSFEVSDEVPAHPTITLSGGVEAYNTGKGEPYYLYTSTKTPTITLNFERGELDKKIQVVKAEIVDSSNIKQPALTIERKGDREFELSNIDLDEGVYTLHLEAKKEKADGVYWDKLGILTATIFIDTTTPEITPDAIITSEIEDIKITGSYVEANLEGINLSSPTTGEGLLGDGTVPWVPIENTGKFEIITDFAGSDSHGTRTLEYTIFDKAGHTKSTTVTATVDKKGPGLTIADVTADYPEGSVKKISELKYTTGGNVTIRANYSDETNAKSVDILDTDTTLELGDKKGEFSIGIKVTANKNVTFVIKDSADNSINHTVELIFDTIGPEIIGEDVTISGGGGSAVLSNEESRMLSTARIIGNEDIQSKLQDALNR